MQQRAPFQSSRSTPQREALTTVGSAISTGSNGPAALVTVAGKFLYSANDAGTVSAFAVNTTTGGAYRYFGIAIQYKRQQSNGDYRRPSGKFLYVANSGSDDISAFTIDANNGRSHRHWRPDSYWRNGGYLGSARKLGRAPLTANFSMPLWIQAYRRVLDQRSLPGHLRLLMRLPHSQALTRRGYR